MDSDRMTTCPEVLPPGGANMWRPESARRAIAEGNLLRDLLKSADGAAYALLVEQAQVRREAERQKTMRPARDAEAVEDVRQAQMRLRGFELADLVLRERVRLGAIAGQRVAEFEDKGLGKLPVPSGVEEAAAWRAEGERVLALVSKPGWDVLVRRWADAAWTAQWLKSVLPAEQAPLLDALAEGIASTIRAIETKFRRGMGAEAYFREQSDRSEGD